MASPRDFHIRGIPSTNLLCHILYEVFDIIISVEALELQHSSFHLV